MVPLQYLNLSLEATKYIFNCSRKSLDNLTLKYIEIHFQFFVAFYI